MLNEAGLPPAVEVVLIERELYEAVCGTAHLFCYIKLILFFSNEAIMHLKSSAKCLGNLIISSHI